MSTDNLAYTECQRRHEYQPAEIGPVKKVGGQERKREAKSTQNREWPPGVWPLNAAGERYKETTPGRKHTKALRNRTTGAKTGEKATGPGNERVALGNRATKPITGDRRAQKWTCQGSPRKSGHTK